MGTPINILDVTGLGPDMNWHLTPSGDLTITTTPTTPPGDYPIEVFGEANGVMRQAGATLIVGELPHEEPPHEEPPPEEPPHEEPPMEEQLPEEERPSEEYPSEDETSGPPTRKESHGLEKRQRSCFSDVSPLDWRKTDSIAQWNSGTFSNSEFTSVFN